MTSSVHMLKKMIKSLNPKVVAAILLLWGCLIVITFLKNSHTNYPALPPALDQLTLGRVRAFIHTTNTKQVINNHKDGPADLVIVIAVHSHKGHLEELIQSLAVASGINNTLLIFSHDSYNPEISRLIYKIRFASTLQIFFPLSIQTHPGEFPGPSYSDYEGRTWRNATRATKKHHWWWTANFVFHRVRRLANYRRFVLFLQSDHYVTEDFAHCLHLMGDYMESDCPTCWFAALGLGIDFGAISMLAYDGILVKKDVHAMGVAFNRTIWNQISQYGESYCKYDDFRWAQSLEYLTTQAAMDYKVATLTMLSPRILSTDICNAYCRSKRKFPQFPTFLETKEYQEPVPYLEQKKGGGWGDARDRALCMGM